MIEEPLRGYIMYWSIVTFVVSRTVSEIRRLIGRKSPISTHSTLIQRPRSGWSPSNFGMNLISPETKMMWLPYGEEIMIVIWTMWTQCTSVTDRRTDGRTDRIAITIRPCNAPLHPDPVEDMVRWYVTGLKHTKLRQLQISVNYGKTFSDVAEKVIGSYSIFIIRIKVKY